MAAIGRVGLAGAILCGKVGGILDISFFFFSSHCFNLLCCGTSHPQAMIYFDSLISEGSSSASTDTPEVRSVNGHG